MAVDFTGTRFDRRRFMLSGVTAFAGVGLADSLATAGDDHDDDHKGHGRPVPVPEPIPGGLPVPGGPGLDPPVHIFLPGEPGTTLPLSGLELMGLDVEPAVITDLKAGTALAYLIGEARGSDGVKYGLEVDLRISEGLYKTADGKTKRGAFALF